MIPPDQQLTDDEWADLLDREAERRLFREPRDLDAEMGERRYDVEKSDALRRPWTHKQETKEMLRDCGRPEIRACVECGLNASEHGLVCDECRMDRNGDC